MERESRNYGAGGAYRRWEAPPEDVIVVASGRPPQQPSDGVAAGAGQQQQHPEPPEKTYYKTKLCEKYVTTGRCMYEDGCTFAHGHSELRAPIPVHGGAWRRPAAEQEHSRGVVRGRVCFMFRESGHCHYGDKCAFPHASAPGQETRNHGEPKLTEAPPPPPLRAFPLTDGRRTAPPLPLRAFPIATAAAAAPPRGRGYAPVPARAFQPAAAVVPVRQLPEEDGVKATPLTLLGLRKTSGIYGDWPEGL